MAGDVQNIGIDLGTCNSCVAQFQGQSAVALVNKVTKQLTTPSYITYPSLAIGQSEKDAPAAGMTVSSFKRLIGRRFSDNEVQEQLRRVEYQIVPHGDHVAVRLQDGRILSPTQVSADFLRQLRRQTAFDASMVVLTVPAYFTHNQKLQTEQAGALAGLQVMRLLAEPTAAALQYNQQLPPSMVGLDENIMVVDLGAGTLDVSILEKHGDVYQVVAASGNNYYGGDDYTSAVRRYLAEKLGRPVGFAEAERVKHRLSEGSYTLYDGVQLSQRDIQDIYAPLDAKLRKPILQALSDSGLTAAQISKVLLVGGQTRQPGIQSKIQEITGIKPSQSVHPDLSVAQGASIQAAILNNQVSSVLLLDATPFSLGIETFGGVYSKIIGRNVTLPVKQSQVFTTTEDGQTEVSIKIYQGEHQLASQNTLLGEFLLPIQPGQPRGAPRIRVEFEIDQNGIVRVSAVDEKTGGSQQVSVKYSSDPEAAPSRSEAEALAEHLRALGVKTTGKESLQKLQALKKKADRRRAAK